MATSTLLLQNEQVVDNSTVRKINKLLNSSETRIEGLQLLSLFLPQLSDEDFLQFCISWMQICCKTDELTKNRDYAINLLSNLFKISSNFKELKKSVSFFVTTRYFDYFCKYLINSQPGWSCTESCLMFYKGACVPFQATLEKHLKSELQKNVRISLVISRCFALMPCIGGGGSEGVTYMKNWKNQFVNFLNACHSILNDLFANVEEFQEYEMLEHTYNCSKKERSSEYLTIQLKNHLMVLNCMLLNQFPAPKNIPTGPVFQLICRVLALNSKDLAKQKIIREKVLFEIQCAFLTFLKALIVTCKNQLVPYSHLICKLIKQILEWTESGFTTGSGNSFGQLRILTYEALCNWLAVAKSGSSIETVSNVIISNAVNDIRTKKKVIFLKEMKLKSQLKGKEQTTHWIDAAVSQRLCLTALKSLQSLIKFSGVLLQPEEHKFMQGVLVKLIKEVQKNSSPNIPVPYGVAECRTELYSVLLEIICQPCSKWPPSTNYALRLFKEGMNDPSSKVSSFCSAALNFSTVIIHPQYDNTGFRPSEAVDSSRTEVELQCRDGELTEVNNGKDSEISRKKCVEVENKLFESDKRNKMEKLNNINEESEISSDEDSRNTVKFFLDSVEPIKRNVDQFSASTTHQVNDEPNVKKQRISTEESISEKTSSPLKKKIEENDSVSGMTEKEKMKKSLECAHSEEFINSKSTSPVTTNEEGHPKARYYLRSKTKGSSEEPEEGVRRNIISEALKTTPTKGGVKSILNFQCAIKKSRTRALSKAETINETEVETLDSREEDEEDGDEENIKAAFNDSFVD